MKFFHVILFLEKEHKKKKDDTTETASLHSAILYSRTCPELPWVLVVLLCGNKDCFLLAILICTIPSLITISVSLFK